MSESVSYNQQSTNNKAIVACVVGVLSLFLSGIGFILGVVGIIISYFALKEIKETGARGRAIALAGVICSVISISVYLLLFLLGIIIFITSTVS